MSFFRYPGGKAKLKHQIVKELKLVTGAVEYREPFFGGGSICIEMLLSDPTFTSIWLNDKDTGIAALWMSVYKYSDALKRSINEFVPTPTAFYEIKEELLQNPELPTEEADTVLLGLKKLAIQQISFSGLGTKSGGPLGGKDQSSSYKIDCRWSPSYLCKKIDTMHRLLSQVEIKVTSIDYEALITDDTTSSVIYLDPPYFVKGNSLYQCGFTQDDHERLARLLRKNPFWVLSYDDCPEVKELYSWADVRVIDVQYSITSSRKKQELLILPPRILEQTTSFPFTLDVPKSLQPFLQLVS